MKRNFFKILKGFLKLTRIEHSFMLIIAVLIGELLAFNSFKDFRLDIFSLVLSLLVPSFLSMSAFAINDYFDYESDLINKRFDRPLVSKIIKRNEALMISIFIFLLSLFLSLFLNEIAFAITLIFGILSFIYSYKLKDIALVGNSYVALSMAIPIIFGGIVVGSLNQKHFIISFIIFFAGIAREITQSIRDYKGDAIARKSKNIVSLIGKRISAILSFIFYILAISLSFILFIFFKPYILNPFYAIFVGACDIILFYVSFFSLFNYNNLEFLKKTRNLTLIAMLLALFGFFLPLVFS